MKQGSIGGKPVGGSAPCFIIAEAGSNHNGDLAMARELVETAARAGADAVKFQTFKASRLYPKSAGTSDYLGVDTPIFDIIQSMEMPESWLRELSDLAHDRGLAFISSPFHEEAVALLDPFVDAFKIASYELTHEPLLRAVAERDKPIIISTGASTLTEVREAVNVLRDHSAQLLVVLQCTAAYPAPLESAQVSALVHLRERLGVLSGLSDHTEHPSLAPTVAAALGASVVEKHFTLSKALPGPDHAFAIEPDGLKALVEGVRGAERVRGHGRKEVHAVEEELRAFARRSIFTTAAIKKGTPFDRTNLDVLRQGKLGQGLAPKQLATVLTGIAARDLPADHALQGAEVWLAQGQALSRPADTDPRVELRRAEERDLGLVWVWTNDPVTRGVSLDPRPITYRDHTEWFRASLLRPDRSLWIAELAHEPAAVVRLDHPDGATPEVSLHVGPQGRGQGLGRAALRQLAVEARRLGFATIGAAIQTENAASIRAFVAVGYAVQGQRNIRGVDVPWYELAL